MAAGGFITDLKQKFRQGDIVTRLIFLNVGAFLLVSLVSLFLTLFRWNAYAWLHWLELHTPGCIGWNFRRGYRLSCVNPGL